MNGVHSSEQEPYRATKLWNEIIQTFCSELPRGKHRRHMRQYNNCFSGSEAVTWLQLYLKSNHNFGPNITRSQASQLLQKFHKNGIFEDVRGYKNTRDAFQDDGRLYMFIKRSPRKPKTYAKSPVKITRAPLASLDNNENSEIKDPFVKPQAPVQKPLGNKYDPYFSRKSLIRKRFETRGHGCKVALEKPRMLETNGYLTIYEVQEVWKEAITSRLQALLKVPSMNEVLDISCVNAQNLIHNTYRIGKSGVVSLLDKTEDLPHWVTSAMKCLVNWPKGNGSDSCLPRYEGFENDVFRVLVEYFSALRNPLLTFDFFHLFVTIFIRGEYFEKNASTQFSEQSSQQMSSSSSIENLMSSITNPKYFQSTPVTNYNSNCSLNYTHYSMVPILKANPVIKTCVNCELPPNSCYETAFENETPVTRIIPRRRLSVRSTDHGYVDMSSKNNVQLLSVTKRNTTSFDDLNAEYVDMAPSLDSNRTNYSLRRSLSTDTVCSPSFTRNAQHFMRRSERRSRSPVESMHRGYATVRRIKRGDENRKIAKNSRENEFCGYVNHGFRTQSREDLQDASYNQSRNSTYYSARSNIDLDESRRSRLSSNFSCSNVSVIQSMDSISNLSSPGIFSSNQFPCKIPKRAASLSDVSMLSSSTQHLYLSDIHYDVLDANQSVMLEAFQLGCLFLPTVNRRHLHLLLRVINKMSSNDDLILDPHLSNEEYALKELAKCILHPENEKDYDETIIMRILSVLLHHCEVIFRPHDDLKKEVETKLQNSRQLKRIPINGPVTFCDRISSEEFETQKQTTQSEVMAGLLENIITSDQLSSKEKSKKLNQFKELYPEVYNMRFPNGDSEANQRPKMKNSKSQILTRLKSIRI